MNDPSENRTLERSVLVALIVVLLCGFVGPVTAGTSINDKVVQLKSLDAATLDDVVRVLGEPAKYALGGKTFTKDALPAVYIAAYPNELDVVMRQGRVMELRFEGPAAGYVHEGKLTVGSSLEDVLDVIGPPAETVEGQRVTGTDGVLFKDIKGKKGHCYYSRADRGVRFFFMDYKVIAIYVIFSVPDERETRQRQASAVQSGQSSGNNGRARQGITMLSPQPPGPMAFPKIDRYPAAATSRRGPLASFPKPNPKAPNPFDVDVRGRDLSALDLRDAVADLPYASFDDHTVWPPSDRLPNDFDWKRVMEMGKNPGLGVRSLHARGITGRGVGIAIIDNPLLVDHVEYADRLRLYAEHNVQAGCEAHMHGPSVASIAVGKTVGVAPEADLYYIGRWAMDLDTATGGEPTLNFRYGAEAIRRILQINTQLPEDRKIRVISMSIGWSPSQKGYAEITAAAERVRAAGMLLICSSLREVHGFEFHGLGRDLLGDPEDFNSYKPAAWGTHMYPGQRRLLVPMDARTTASPTGKDRYVFYAQGGWSWAIPYIAGAYALAAQVEPAITPDRFWTLAMKTGRTVERTHQGRRVSLGPILDPVRLIAALQTGPD